MTLVWADPPGAARGMWIRTATGTVIVLATWLTRRERRCTLSHELVHDERGVGFDETIAQAVVAKEEAIVHRESIRRLVPMDELELLVAGASEYEAVTATMVAEHFDVTADVARAALERLPVRHSPVGG